MDEVEQKVLRQLDQLASIIDLHCSRRDGMWQIDGSGQVGMGITLLEAYLEWSFSALTPELRPEDQAVS